MKIVRQINTWLHRVSMVLLVGLTILVFIQMIMRNVFLSGAPWMSEMSRWLMITMVYLAVPIVTGEGLHVAVDLYSNGLPQWALRLSKLFISLLCLAFGIVFLVSEYTFMSAFWNIPSPVMQIPDMLFFGGPIIGMLGMVLNTITGTVDLLKPASGEAVQS